MRHKSCIFNRITLTVLLATLVLVSCGSPTDRRIFPPGTVIEDGIATNESTGLITGLTLDQNLDDTGPIEISGAQWTDGVVGSALAFNGFDHYAAVPDSPELTLASEGTLLLWIKINSYSNYGGLLHKGERADFQDEAWTLQFWLTTGQLVLFLFNSYPGPSMDVRSNVYLPAGIWIHVAATWDAATVQLYFNGLPDASKPNTIGTVWDSPGRLMVGAQSSTPIVPPDRHFGFDGIIDEVQIYDRALSAGEVDNAYRTGWP